MDDSTSQLRARARAGDADAFGAVFDACAKSVYNHAFRLTGDWSAAEEVMAMTFLEAWRSRERITEDGGSLRPWLLGIATNLARGQRRAAWRQRNALARLAVAADVPDLADDVSGRLDDVDRIKALHRALAGLASLPADPQALLKVIAGQDPQNIAAGNPIAGVAPKTEAQREFDDLTLIQGITDTAGGQAIGISGDGGYDQLLIDPDSDQVIGIRQLSTGIGPMTIAQALASGHISPSLRKLLAGLTKAERDRLITEAKKQHPPAYPPKGTLIQEIVYAQTAKVPAPGDR